GGSSNVGATLVSSPGTATTVNVTMKFGGTITATPRDFFGNSVTGGCMDIYTAAGVLAGSDCEPEGEGLYAVSVGSDSGSVTSYKARFRDFAGRQDLWRGGNSLSSA